MAKKPRPGVVGWLLSDIDKAALLERFPPLYPDLEAHHVTLVYGVQSDYPLPIETSGFVVGRVDDKIGLEALVVSIGGTVDRPDGSTYHITWSIDREAGYQPKMSNDVILDLGWDEVKPISIQLEPKFFY